MDKHTPGPWHYNVEEEGGNPDITVTNKSGNILADIGGGKLETRLANAQLMAAAPEMLAELKRVYYFLRANRNDIQAEPYWMRREFEDLAVVIAKAEGNEVAHG